MKIEMTETVQGSLDGETVQKLVKGHVYDTVDSPRGDRLAQYHIDQGVAMAAQGDPLPESEPAEKTSVPKKGK